MSVILGVTFDNDIAYVWLIGNLFCNMSQINRKKCLNSVSRWYILDGLTVAYSELCQTSKMEGFIETRKTLYLRYLTGSGIGLNKTYFFFSLDPW